MLRLPRAADAAALLELARDPDVTRWFSWGPYRTIHEPLAWLDTLDGRRARGEQLDLLVVHREHGPAGITGLGELSVRDRRCTVGTWLGRRFWGTGVNREAKALVAHLAFAVLGMHRLGCYANPANARSTRAVLGVGFRREGLLRQYHRHGDAHLDVEVFAMLRSDWEGGALAGVPVRVEGDPPAAFVVAGA